jgi:hypothetical protein
MTPTDDQERLGIVAALLCYDKAQSNAAGTWMHRDHTPLTEAERSEIASATSTERVLADGLCTGPDPLSDADAMTIAALLRLVAGTDIAAQYGLGLRQAFLLPDDSRHAPAREERTSAITDLYRKLALPGLRGDAREQAVSMLALFERPRAS